MKKAQATPGQANEFLTSIDSSPLKQTVKMKTVLSRPGVNFDQLSEALPELKDFLANHKEDAIESAEVMVKYEGYLLKEQEQVDKMSRLEELVIRDDFEYNVLQSLSAEAREKLTTQRPRTLGQASRISGVSMSDVSVLLVHMGR